MNEFFIGPADLNLAFGSDQFHLGIVSVLDIRCAVDTEVDSVLSRSAHQDTVIIIRMIFPGFRIAEITGDRIERINIASGHPAQRIDIMAVDFGENAV